MRNLYLLILLSLTLGCITTITPDASIAVNDTAFSQAKLDTFLSQHVDKNSLINYPSLNANSIWPESLYHLDRYYKP